MGTIRTLLAIAVVLGHTGSSLTFIRGQIAVELFYVSSGFLISFALFANDHYRKNLGAFYLNRALRLYPIYFAVLAVASFGYLAFPAVLGKPPELGPELAADTKTFIRISTITLIGQDWAYLLGHEDGHLIWQPQFWLSKPPLWTYFPAPQAWTLGVEITFYLVAPFILLRRRLLLLLLCVFGAVKIAAFAMNAGEPWLYRVFPIELSLFLLGAVVHQFGVPFYKRLTGDRLSWHIWITTATIGILLVYRWLPVPSVDISREGLPAALAFAIVVPALFAFQSRFRWDRAIGELSYPIYICHWVMMSVGPYVLGRFDVANAERNAQMTTLLSIVAAIALNALVGKPVEMVRSRIRAS